MKITDHAIAYMKGSLPDDGRPVIKLPLKDNPVIRPYFGELHI
jgi:hypothetical protein